MSDSSGFAIAAVLAAGAGLPTWSAIALGVVAAIQLGRSWR